MTIGAISTRLSPVMTASVGYFTSAITYNGTCVSTTASTTLGAIAFASTLTATTRTTTVTIIVCTGLFTAFYAVIGASGVTSVLTRSCTVPVTGVRLLGISFAGIAAGSGTCRLACLAARSGTSVLAYVGTGAVSTNISVVLFQLCRTHTKFRTTAGAGVLALTLAVITTAT